MFSDAAFLAMIYPLFILMAGDADPERPYQHLLKEKSPGTATIPSEPSMSPWFTSPIQPWFYPNHQLSSLCISAIIGCSQG